MWNVRPFGGCDITLRPTRWSEIRVCGNENLAVGKGIAIKTINSTTCEYISEVNVTMRETLNNSGVGCGADPGGTEANNFTLLLTKGMLLYVNQCITDKLFVSYRV